MDTARPTAQNFSPLATADQAEFERTCLRLLQRAEMRQVLAEARDLYLDDMFAKTPAGRKTLEQASSEMVLCLLYLTVVGDLAKPRIIWICNPAHSWFGHKIGGARYGLDSPDRTYRTAILDPAGSYEIRGRRIGGGQAAFSFQLYTDQTYGGPPREILLDPKNSTFGDLFRGRKIDTPLGGLLAEDMEFGADGSYLVTLSPEPAHGRANHIQMCRDGGCLLIRSAWLDWETETPDWMEIRRLDQPSASPMSDAELVARAVDYIGSYVPYWLKFNHFYWLGTPANTVPPPIGRGGGFGYQTFGTYQLADDEVLLVTIHPQGARYIGFCLYQLWCISLEHIYCSCSRNNFQSQPNADGSFTYAIAAHDPGVVNWLDNESLEYGGYMIRWEAFPPEPASVDGLVRDVKLVKMADLDQTLPKGTPRITPEQRAGELAARAKAFNRRFAE